MCAIFGLMTRDPKETVSRDALRDWTRTMSHRGPDDEGYYVDRGIGLGHRRLSIIDLQGGRQPIFNEDGSVCTVFNGEIYNFRELREELKSKGHVFRTRSDSETIVHAYEEYGLDCASRFHGMFALAIWDHPRRRLVLARDRVGKKPLYYLQNEKGIVFASEIKALFKSGRVSPKVNQGMLDFYLTLGYVPGPETLFEGIHKLAPAHVLVYEGGQISIREYWRLEDVQPAALGFGEACRKLERLLFESVEKRLMSDVPLGVFLSGGLDSASIVSCMSRLGVKPIKTFSVGYDDRDRISELEQARIISEHFSAEHHEFRLEPADFFNSLDMLLEYTEEPIVEASGIPLFQIAKMAKPHATVLLSGEGGDELFAGYGIYAKMQTLNKIRRLLPFVPFEWVADVIAKCGFPEKIQKYVDWLATPQERRYQTVSNDLTRTVKNRLYSDSFLNSINGRLEKYFSDLARKGNRATPLGQMLYADTKTWLADDLLLKGDKMTMAASVETRCPLLDHKLLEFAFSLPDEFKLNGKTGKFIMKRVMDKYLPHGHVRQKKKGFPLPLRTWLQGPLYERARDILLSERHLARGYFRRDYFNRLFAQHLSGRDDLSRRIFLLLVLELWHRKYVDA